MSALATLVRAMGHDVSGSDRSHDHGDTPEKFAALQAAGIVLYPQDGSGVSEKTDAVIVSSAVEKTIPDVKAAIERDVAVRKRADLLAQLFNNAQGVGIGGTSGKTTVTAMAGHIFNRAGFEPTIVNGGVLLNDYEGKTSTGNTVVGKDDGWFVVEMDESDGSIELFDPSISVLTNITLDHKTLDELRTLFSAFIKRTNKGVVLNLDDEESNNLFEKLSDAYRQKLMTVKIQDMSADLTAQQVKYAANSVSFEVVHKASGHKADICLPVPGRHNVSNALCAIGAALWAGIPFDRAVTSLEDFYGTKRRLQMVGEDKGITVIDDFAHNPDKIEASLNTLREFDGRVIVMFQSHGFGPTKMMKDELIESFSNCMGEDDILLMPEIYYAGGTVERSISSQEIIDGVKSQGRRAVFFDTRDEISGFLLDEAKAGDRIVIMGARDDTLSLYAQDILKKLSLRKAA